MVGFEIDNILIEINAEEPPIMDGSSKFFVDALEKAGLKELSSLQEYVVKILFLLMILSQVVKLPYSRRKLPDNNHG